MSYTSLYIYICAGGSKLLRVFVISYTGVSKYVQPEKEKKPSAAENLTQVEASMRKELRQHVGRGALRFFVSIKWHCLYRSFFHLSILE